IPGLAGDRLFKYNVCRRIVKELEVSVRGSFARIRSLLPFPGTCLGRRNHISSFNYARRRGGSGRVPRISDDLRSGALRVVDPLGDSTPGTSRPSLPTLVAAGVLAGLLAFGLGEMTYGFFPPKAVPQPLGGGQVLRPTLETIAAADSRNSAVTFGTMGGVL